MTLTYDYLIVTPILHYYSPSREVILLSVWMLSGFPDCQLWQPRRKTPVGEGQRAGMSHGAHAEA